MTPMSTIESSPTAHESPGWMLEMGATEYRVLVEGCPRPYAIATLRLSPVTGRWVLSEHMTGLPSAQFESADDGVPWLTHLADEVFPVWRARIAEQVVA